MRSYDGAWRRSAVRTVGLPPVRKTDWQLPLEGTYPLPNAKNLSGASVWEHWKSPSFCLGYWLRARQLRSAQKSRVWSTRLIVAKGRCLIGAAGRGSAACLSNCSTRMLTSASRWQPELGPMRCATNGKNWPRSGGRRHTLANRAPRLREVKTSNISMSARQRLQNCQYINRMPRVRWRAGARRPTPEVRLLPSVAPLFEPHDDKGHWTQFGRRSSQKS